MTLNAIPPVLCGLLVLATSALAWTHEILMSPDRPNYPTGRALTRRLMFVWSAALLYRAIDLLAGAWDGAPAPVSFDEAMGCALACLVHASLLESHLRMWRPARTHRTLRRLMDAAGCGRAPLARRPRPCP